MKELIFFIDREGHFRDYYRPVGGKLFASPDLFPGFTIGVGVGALGTPIVLASSSTPEHEYIYVIRYAVKSNQYKQLLSCISWADE